MNIELPLAEIANVCKQHQVRELAIFGSAVRPDFQDTSDIDLLVEFNADARIGLIEFAKLQFEFENLLKRHVDLVPKEGLKPLIRNEVLAQARVLYAA